MGGWWLLVLGSAAISRIALRLLSGWAGLGWAGLVLHHPAIISGQNQLQKHKQHITDPPTSPRVWFSNNCYLPADHSPVISVCPMRLDIALFPHWRSSICSLTGAPPSVHSRRSPLQLTILIRRNVPRLL